ncbi:chromate efflux transporter [Pseudomonas sp. CCM 7891]|uniref:Chromate efflux transporter n=1 Tax=Pseudomonas karstica TaxID=1055468 RepID=A0A7X2V0I0_9PSED|nr:chromate efflux transporter [Pseudomonas karstica]
MISATVIKTAQPESAWRVLLIFLRLGCIAFGGPVAHLGFFRTEFVERRRWLSEASYAELIALCQFLPGPSSSQVGMALGLSRAGYRGALAAWLGFTLPSAAALGVLAMGLTSWGSRLPDGLVHGLKVMAVAVVVQAVWAMARLLCTDSRRWALAIMAACVAVLWSAPVSQVLIMIVAAGLGVALLKPSALAHEQGLVIGVSRRAGAAMLALFVILLLGLPVWAQHSGAALLEVFAGFYRSGALVFGGGHVVLPLLEQTVVASGWVDSDTFLAGYAATQAMPGPLFSFSAFLGAVVHGWTGALLCVLAIFLPSMLLVIGVLPFWQSLRTNPSVQAALAGVNAAVVGLLLAALYQPLWTTGILAPMDFALMLLALLALMIWKWPPWLVVALGGAAGVLISL